MEGAAAAAPPSPDWDYLAEAAPSLNWDHVKKIWALESKEESEYIKEHGQSLYNTRRIFNAYLKLPLQMNGKEVQTLEMLIDADIIDADIMEGGDPGENPGGSGLKRLNAMKLDPRIMDIMAKLDLQIAEPRVGIVGKGRAASWGSTQSQRHAHDKLPEDASSPRLVQAGKPTPGALPASAASEGERSGYFDPTGLPPSQLFYPQ